MERASTVKQVMEKLGMSRATMWNYRQKGLPFDRKLNGQARFNIEECEKWIKEHTGR